LFAATLFALTPLAGGAQPAAADGDEIGRLENLYSQSFVTGDARVAERLLADDFIGFGPGGKTWNKAAMLAMVRSTPHQASAKITSIIVRRHGETAIALGTEDDTESPSMSVSHREWLDTWRSSAKGWLMIASAEIEPKPR
jgi:hypothetical protein